VLSAKTDKQIQLSRFLPPTPIKMCIDAKQNNLDKQFIQLSPVKAKMGNQLITALKPQLETCLQQALQQAEDKATQVKTVRTDYMQEQLGDELSRLQSLQKVNPAIRDEEIEHVENQISQLNQVMSDAKLHLEAVRLIVNNPQ
jgi:ATP-dependent helicase HepA